MSLRNSLTRQNFSHSGFQQIPNARMEGDASINIPMEPVHPSVSAKTSGSRRVGDRSPGMPSQTSYNEKRVSMGHSRKGHHATKGEDGSKTTMGRVYEKIKNFSIITRYLLYVIPVAFFLAIPIALLSIRSDGFTRWKTDGSHYDRARTPHDQYCSDEHNSQNAVLFIFEPSSQCSDWKRWGGVRPLWIFVWLEVFWCALWVSKLFAKAAPSIFQFLCGIVSPGVRKYKSVLKKLEIPISLCIWFLIGLLTWTGFVGIDAPDYTKQAAGTDSSGTPKPVNQNVSDIAWANTFQHVILCFLIGSLVYLAEQTLIQVISISYHHTQYDAKIKVSKHNIDNLTLLYDASVSLFPAYCPEFAEEDYIINDSLELPKAAAGLMGGAARPKSGNATPMRLIQNVGRFGDKVTAVFGNIASEVTGKQVFNPMASHSIVIEALEKKRSCEALARRIWMSLVVEGRDALYLDDVQEVLSGHHHANPEEVFSTLDKDGNGDVSLDEMILTIVEFGRERKDIATSLHDVDQAIKVLDRLLMFVVFLIIILVFVLVLSPSAVTSFTTVGTSLLSLSFVFAVTCQEVLGSCIFLFVKHPYDVGDRVDVNDKTLVVERISLLFTIFKCTISGKHTQVPNIVMNTLWVDNVSRSGVMKEQLSVFIDFTTSLQDIELLRAELQAFVLDKENSRDFQSEILVEVTGIAEMNKMELRVEIRHKSNWHNETLRASRRSKFMCALVLALRKVPINAPGGADAALGSANQPAWSVAISPEAAKSARQAFQDAAAAKKLSNQKSTNSDGGSTTSANPQFLTPDGSFRQRKGDTGNAAGLAPNANEAAALSNLTSRSPTSEFFGVSGTGQASQSPGRPAVENSKSPVRADTQRMRDLNNVYDTLQKSPSVGKRRESYNLNVTAASPTDGYMPKIAERDILTPSADSSPSQSEFDGAATHGSRRRSGSPSGKAYSPLGRDTFEDSVFNNSAWGTPVFNDQGGSSPYKTYNAPPPPPAPTGRYASPPPQLAAAQQHAAAAAYQAQQQQQHSAQAAPQSPGESWFHRDSDLVDNSVHTQTNTSKDNSPVGPPSARASSVALGSFVGASDTPATPTAPMPAPSRIPQEQSRLQQQVSRGQSTKSDASFRRGDDGAHF